MGSLDVAFAWIGRRGTRTVCALAACAIACVGFVPDSYARATVPACSLPSPVGLRTIALTNQGQSRPFLLYVPRGYAATKRVPVVFDLHGSGGNGAQQLALTNIEPLADRKGFAVVAPSGAVPVGTDAYDWNVPGVPLIGGSPVPAGTPSDERYLIAVLRHTQRTICVNSHRVYMTGFSGGARMTSQMACDHSGYFAAIAPVAGLRAGVPIEQQGKWTPNVATCKPKLPVPVITFHGTADTTNPFDGSNDPRWGYSVLTALRRWGRLDHCAGAATSTPVTSTTTMIGYAHCAGGAAVWLYRSNGAVHSWPGSTQPGADTTINATSLIWRFFHMHQR